MKLYRFVVRAIDLTATDDPGHRPLGMASTLRHPVKAPAYDCASIAYFKMVDAQVILCFPDDYQLGLDVLVLVRGSCRM
jgi:hypothetical protein